MKILILEDNVNLAKNIVEYLKIKWIKAETDFDGNRWFQKVLDSHYDILVLDINLPWKDWISICQDLRKKWKDIPIIMLTSRNTSKDVVYWLNVWADDYLWKPFDMEELVSRLEALNRRNLTNKTDIIEILDLEIDVVKRKVKKNWVMVDLSNLEFDLLKFLIQNRWTPVNRKTLFEKVWWEFDSYMFSRTVDVYIWYLRKKLWDNLIDTIKWFWYIIN